MKAGAAVSDKQRRSATREWTVLILTGTVAISVLALVGAAVYAIIINSLDWHETHIKGANITNPLAALIGSIVSALIAGVVGYISGQQAARRHIEKQNPYGPPFLHEKGSGTR